MPELFLGVWRWVRVVVEVGVGCDSPGETDIGAFGCDGVDNFVFQREVHAGYRSVDLSEGFADFFFRCPVIWT